MMIVNTSLGAYWKRLRYSGHIQSSHLAQWSVLYSDARQRAQISDHIYQFVCIWHFGHNYYVVYMLEMDDSNVKLTEEQKCKELWVYIVAFYPCILALLVQTVLLSPIRPIYISLELSPCFRFCSFKVLQKLPSVLKLSTFILCRMFAWYSDFVYSCNAHCVFRIPMFVLIWSEFWPSLPLFHALLFHHFCKSRSCEPWCDALRTELVICG